MFDNRSQRQSASAAPPLQGQVPHATMLLGASAGTSPERARQRPLGAAPGERLPARRISLARSSRSVFDQRSGGVACAGHTPAAYRGKCKELSRARAHPTAAARCFMLTRVMTVIAFAGPEIIDHILALEVTVVTLSRLRDHSATAKQCPSSSAVARHLSAAPHCRGSISYLSCLAISITDTSNAEAPRTAI